LRRGNLAAQIPQPPAGRVNRGETNEKEILEVGPKTGHDIPLDIIQGNTLGALDQRLHREASSDL